MFKHKLMILLPTVAFITAMIFTGLTSPIEHAGHVSAIVIGIGTEKGNTGYEISTVSFNQNTIVCKGPDGIYASEELARNAWNIGKNTSYYTTALHPNKCSASKNISIPLEIGILGSVGSLVIVFIISCIDEINRYKSNLQIQNYP